MIFSQVLHRTVSSLELWEEAPGFDEKEPFAIFEDWQCAAILIAVIFLGRLVHKDM